jgi:Flp pilus assembly protein TadD
LKRFALLTVALAGFVSCSRDTAKFERVAILPFENLTGDAALDWMSRVASAVVTADLTGVPRIFAARVESMRDAYLMHATWVVHGSFTGRGNDLNYAVEIEDLSRRKMLRSASIIAPGTGALDAAARQVDPSALPFPVTNLAALEAWGRNEAERAVSIEPDFGAAWLMSIEQRAVKGDREGALGLVQQALGRPTLRTPVERARIELAAALLRNDRDAERSALEALLKLVPADPQLLRALATAEMNGRHYSRAAELFRRLSQMDPGNGEPLNSLGYAELYAGNLDAARKALEEYRAFLETNAYDSLGEVHFLAGKFADAEKYFLQAHEKDAAYHGGADLLKAAHARWLGGDLSGADAIHQRYIKFRAGLHDPLVAWREAVWLYSTGRRAEAEEKLKGAPAVAAAQLAVWSGEPQGSGPYALLLEKKFAEAAEGFKQIYESTPPGSDSQVRVLYAWALAEAGRKDEARALLKWWPLPGDAGNPLFESLIVPKFVELRKTLEIK